MLALDCGDGQWNGAASWLSHPFFRAHPPLGFAMSPLVLLVADQRNHGILFALIN